MGKGFFSYLNQMNELYESRTESSQRKKDEWLKKRKIMLILTLCFLLHRIGQADTDLRMDPGVSKLEFWHLDLTLPFVQNLDLTDRSDNGKLIWDRRRFQILPQTGLLIVEKLHSCGIRFTTGECHANKTPSRINIVENLGKGFLQEWHHELWPGYPIGLYGQSKATCRRAYFFPGTRKLTLKWTNFFLPAFFAWDQNKGHPPQTELEPLWGHINAPLTAGWTPSFSHLKTEVRTERERGGGWLAESAPMGAGCDPVWPRFDLAVTSDLSGPGSPPALLPGFGNAPPWGPERPNQNEEEPQRAVCDWRRGENINNQGWKSAKFVTCFHESRRQAEQTVCVFSWMLMMTYKPCDFHTSKAPFVLVVIDVCGRTQKSVDRLSPPATTHTVWTTHSVIVLYVNEPRLNEHFM